MIDQLKKGESLEKWFDEDEVEHIYGVLKDNAEMEMEKKGLKYNIMVGATLHPLFDKEGEEVSLWVEWVYNKVERGGNLKVTGAIVFDGEFEPQEVTERAKKLLDFLTSQKMN